MAETARCVCAIFTACAKTARCALRRWRCAHSSPTDRDRAPLQALACNARELGCYPLYYATRLGRPVDCVGNTLHDGALHHRHRRLALRLPTAAAAPGCVDLGV